MKRNEAYFILISTFVLIVAWIIFSILQSAFNSTISEPINAQINPIIPSFDTQTIAAVKKRQVVAPAAEIQTPIASDAAQTPTPTIAVPSITPVSSISGQQTIIP